MKKLILGLTLSATFVACGPRQNSNTASTPPEGTPIELNGTINGGGGKGVLCLNRGQQTYEVLDIYEGREHHKLKYSKEIRSEKEMVDTILDLLVRHFQNLFGSEKDLRAEIKKEFIEPLLNSIKYTEKNQRLKFVGDDLSPLIADNCKPIQLAIYYDEAVLLIDGNYWAKLNWLNRTALLLHELIYRLAREKGQVNSIQSRRLVGSMLSDTGAKPIVFGVPERGFIRCFAEAGDSFSTINFDAYNLKTDDFSGVEAVFYAMGLEVSLFHTSARFLGLHTSVMADSREEESTYYSKALIDGQMSALYKIGFDFRQRKEGDFKMMLKDPKSNSDSKIYRVRCGKPTESRSDSDPKLNVTKNFIDTYGDHSFRENIFREAVRIGKDGTIQFLFFRQVGREGSKEVPFPTECSYFEKGLIKSVVQRTKEDMNSYLPYATHIITYNPQSIELTDEIEKTSSFNPACRFMAERKEFEMGKDFYEKVYAELLDDTSFRLHTTGGGSFDPEKGRTEEDGTLDELYKIEK